MKKRMKSLIAKSDFLSGLVFEKGIGVKVSLGAIVVNYVLNFLLRQNRSAGYPVNFRSTVVGGQKLTLCGSKRGTFASLVLSHGCYLQAGNGIEIGEGTIWAPNVAIISANHDLENEGRDWVAAAPIRVGRNCWIGANAVILPSVEIGDNTIVGAGAVVTKSFPAGNLILAGNPATIIREIQPHTG